MTPTADIFYKDNGMHQVPTRGSEGAAGWDMYAAEDTVLPAYKPTLVPTCFDVAVPDGYALLVMSRSGNSLKQNIIIPNSPGLIDEDYRGHLHSLMTYIPHPHEALGHVSGTGHSEIYKDTKCFHQVKKGDRIAQLVLIQYIKQNWEEKGELPPTKRGRGGYGSTGESGTPDATHSSTDTKI